MPKERGIQIAEAFFAASRSGDIATLRTMLAADVTVHSDGGGKHSAAMAPIVGIEEVMQLHGLARLFTREGSTLVRTGLIDGLPGFVTREADGRLQTTALELEDGKVVNIYVVRNPDKLRRLDRGAMH